MSNGTNVVPFQCPDVPCQIPPWGPFPPPWFGPVQPPWYPGANAGVTFSLTMPINVIRGHFWWDGSVLRMFDGVTWVLIGGDGSIDGGGAAGGRIGVTDGSVAKPGEIGEIIKGTVSGNWVATADVSAGINTFTPVTVPPGDWDLNYICRIDPVIAGTSGLQGAFIRLNPLPSGVVYDFSAGNLGGFVGSGGAGVVAAFHLDLVSLTVSASFATPQPLTFELDTYAQGTSGQVVTGSYQFNIAGRRMR